MWSVSRARADSFEMIKWSKTSAVPGSGRVSCYGQCPIALCVCNFREILSPILIYAYLLIFHEYSYARLPFQIYWFSCGFYSV